MPPGSLSPTWSPCPFCIRAANIALEEEILHLSEEIKVLEEFGIQPSRLFESFHAVGSIHLISARQRRSFIYTYIYALA